MEDEYLNQMMNYVPDDDNSRILSYEQKKYEYEIRRRENELQKHYEKIINDMYHVMPSSFNFPFVTKNFLNISDEIIKTKKESVEVDMGLVNEFKVVKKAYEDFLEAKTKLENMMKLCKENEKNGDR